VVVDDLGFAPLDDTGAQLLFRFVAAAYERRSLGVASHWPFESWGRFLPEHTTAVALLDRLLRHAVTVVTSGDSYRMRKRGRERVGRRRRSERPPGAGTSWWTPAGRSHGHRHSQVRIMEAPPRRSRPAFSEPSTTSVLAMWFRWLPGDVPEIVSAQSLATSGNSALRSREGTGPSEPAATMPLNLTRTVRGMAALLWTDGVTCAEEER
jgi:hypothetical protein